MRGLTGTFACSIVSSSLLGKIAAAHGLGYEETLTGFKWISRVDGLRFGYEEWSHLQATRRRVVETTTS